MNQTQTSNATPSELRVLFIHGLEGSPEGIKASYLADRFAAKTPRMQTANFPRCVELQARMIREFTPEVLVGSSFGGAVALALLQRGEWHGPTLLLAPAIDHFKVEGRVATDAPILVVHGKRDEVVDINGSRRLAQAMGSGQVELVEVDDTHRLESLTSDESLADYVRQAAKRAAKTKG